MKKFFKITSAFFLIVFMIPGCRGSDASNTVFRTVTQIDVVCTRENETLYRTYHTPKKLEAILLYLRLLSPYGRAEVDPEALEGDIFDITVHFSDGRQRIYRQRSDRFVSKDFAPWQNIDTDHAQKLYPLLLLMPGDTV